MKIAALLCLLACAGYAAACAHTYTHNRGLMAVRSWLTHNVATHLRYLARLWRCLGAMCFGGGTAAAFCRCRGPSRSVHACLVCG